MNSADPLFQEIKRRFTHHAPSPDKMARHGQIRQHGRLFAELICDTVPDGRERSLALTNLEQVVMWANAGIAREGTS